MIDFQRVVRYEVGLDSSPACAWTLPTFLVGFPRYPALVALFSNGIELVITHLSIKRHMDRHSPDSGAVLSAMFRLIEAHRNEIRPRPASSAANRSGCSP